MTLAIKQAGEEVLRQRARTLTHAEIRRKDFAELIEAMRETMREAPGVGLAAPQIGLPLRLAVIEDPAGYQKDLSREFLEARGRRPVEFHVIVNPEIVSASESKAEFFEGCLSLTGYVGIVPRALEVTVRCLDETGAEKMIHASGWYARILQHEIDHLHGNLYIDRMLPPSFMSNEQHKRIWQGVGESEILARLGAHEPSRP